MLQLGHPSANRKLSASAAVTLLRQALKQGFAHTPPEDVMEGLLAPCHTEVGKLSMIRNAAALNTNLTTEITTLLPRISMPTLILWGEDDKFQMVETPLRDVGSAGGSCRAHSSVSHLAE